MMANAQQKAEAGKRLSLATHAQTGRDSWGVALFLLAPLLIVSLLFTWNRISSELLSRLALPTSLAGLILSVFCIFLGRFSYPRVHNLKVFLLCYLTAVVGLFYYVPQLAGMKQRIPEAFILSLLQVHLLLVLLLPSYVKYRVIRFLTVILVTAELSLLAFVMFHGPPGLLIPDRGWMFWLMSLWPLLVLVLSFLTMKREFKLGGVVTGCSYFYAVGFLVLMGRIPLPLIISSLLTGALVYFILGIMAHWFSRMEHRVSYDPLLQIYNRNFCSRIIEEQTRLNTLPPFGVAMVDIDHFKQVNDTWGHQTGDRVLIAVAQAIQREVVPGGVLCRYGGEELAVFFPGMSSSDILPIMEEARTSVESLNVQNGQRRSISVTISCGISHRSSVSQRVVDVIKGADRALYRAKESGRNRVVSGRAKGSSSGRRRSGARSTGKP
jgi:diguanylate cyclase (GGDEF)-like protein